MFAQLAQLARALCCQDGSHRYRSIPMSTSCKMVNSSPACVAFFFSQVLIYGSATKAVKKVKCDLGAFDGLCVFLSFDVFSLRKKISFKIFFFPLYWKSIEWIYPVFQLRSPKGHELFIALRSITRLNCAVAISSLLQTHSIDNDLRLFTFICRHKHTYFFIFLRRVKSSATK